MIARSLLGFVLLMGSALAHCDEAPATAPPFVVSGTRLSTEVSQTLAQTTVIGRDEIESRRAFSLVEILRQVAGVHVIEQGGRGGFSSVLLRGGEPNFTAVFVDGVQVNDSTNSRGGSFDFSTLTADDIERIEVVRGAQSAVYGSDALAGVINIVTRRDADELGVAGNIDAGSDGFRRAAATLAVPLGELSLRASLYTEDDGDPVDGSAWESTGGRLAAGFSLADSTTLVADLSVVRADAESFPEDSGGPRLAVIREVEKRKIDEDRYRLGLRHSWATGVGMTLSASRYERKELSDAPGIAPGVINFVPPIFSDTRFRRDTVSLVFGLDRSGPFSGALGAELRSEEGDSTGTIDFGVLIPTDFAIDRDTKSVFVEGSYQPNADWLFNAGLRHDDHDSAGSQTNLRLAIRYRLRDSGVTLQADWGEAFKLASFFALAMPLIANPDLLPEKSRSASIGLDYEHAHTGVSLSVELFRNTFRDLVDFDPILFTNVNRSKVVTKGLEIAQSWTAHSGRLSVTSHASYLEADFLGSDQRPRGRPHLRAGVGVLWQPRSQLDLRGDVWYTDSVFESSVATGFVELGAYVRADIAASWRVNDRWSWYAGVQNLLARDYEQAVGFASPGRRVHVGLSYAK